jgi:hypothetical protein
VLPEPERERELALLELVPALGSELEPELAPAPAERVALDW